MLKLHSSVGEILVRDNGVPYRETLPQEYHDIVKFDLKRLEKFCTVNHLPIPVEWDILGIAYWTSTGHYEEPASDYSEVGYMRYIWRGDADNIDEAMELNGDL